MNKNKPIRSAIKLILNKWKDSLFIVLFDLLFILILIKSKFLLSNLDRLILSLSPKTNIVVWYILYISYMIIILGLFTLIYAFFKYLVISFIYKMFRKAELKFDNLFQFLKLNLFLLTPILFIFIVYIVNLLGFIRNLISRTYDPFTLSFIFLIGFILTLLFFIYIYTLTNLSHFLFLKETRIVKIIKQTFINSFKLRPYKIYWTDFKIILVFLIILLFTHIFIKSFVLNEFSLYLAYYGVYKNVIIIFTFAVGYLIVLINRINFYYICCKTKEVNT